jgi:hypothetical protein
MTSTPDPHDDDTYDEQQIVEAPAPDDAPVEADE